MLDYYFRIELIFLMYILYMAKHLKSVCLFEQIQIDSSIFRKWFK